jgi:hypothetical protein
MSSSNKSGNASNTRRFGHHLVYSPYNEGERIYTEEVKCMLLQIGRFISLFLMALATGVVFSHLLEKNTKATLPAPLA